MEINFRTGSVAQNRSSAMATVAKCDRWRENPSRQTEALQELLRAAYALEFAAGLILEHVARACQAPLVHLSLLNHLEVTHEQARYLRSILEQPPPGAPDLAPSDRDEPYKSDWGRGKP